jgi:hypothetical protein
MGIHGNATAVLNFDDAKGFLIGAPHSGLSAMFTYMNVARIGTASQGTAAAERSYQGAAAYAIERLAMRSISGVKNPDGPADPIVCHPDVRRMLLTQRVIAEGSRAMICYASQFADLYTSAKNPADKKKGEDRLGFCTPILKGFITEQGVVAANYGVQVFGGHGYIKEWGMEQILRDSRIATIYEGTTGIQALDLIGRKTLMDKFAQLKIFTAEMRAFAMPLLLSSKTSGTIRKYAWHTVKMAFKWQYLAFRMGLQAKKNRDAIGAGSVDFLMFSGYAFMTHMWMMMAAKAEEKLEAGQGDCQFFEDKLHTAEFFFERYLPQSKVHAKTISSNLESVMGMSSEFFDNSK